jgi:hypothetical protein
MVLSASGDGRQYVGGFFISRASHLSGRSGSEQETGAGLKWKKKRAK